LETPLDSEVTKQAKKLGNVDVLGFVTDNEKFFSAIDCLVISSEIEGIPLSAMEALSCGVPIISTRVGGIPELITREEQGYSWSGDPKEAITLIQKLKENKLTRKASALLDEKFWRKTTSTKVINRILEL
jgi:glycosyltransferase involved in cell wall biosynthesis